jgi:hypothetical protein
MGQCAARTTQLTVESICNQFTGGMKRMVGWQRVFMCNEVYNFVISVQQVNKASKNVKPSSKRNTPPIDSFRLRNGLLQLRHQKKKPDDILHEVLSTMLYFAFLMHESNFKKVSTVGRRPMLIPSATAYTSWKTHLAWCTRGTHRETTALLVRLMMCG